MRHPVLSTALLLVATSAVTMLGSQSARVETPVLSPDDEMRTFSLAPGYRVELERVAPSLVGSETVLGSPAASSRVLMQGKEGDIGLMPPLGGSLSDEQIAGVLTYIRREWGQTAPPVDPALVKRIRAQTADRSRPWTKDELAAIGQ